MLSLSLPKDDQQVEGAYRECRYPFRKLQLAWIKSEYEKQRIPTHSGLVLLDIALQCILLYSIELRVVLNGIELNCAIPTTYVEILKRKAAMRIEHCVRIFVKIPIIRNS